MMTGQEFMFQFIMLDSIAMHFNRFVYESDLNCHFVIWI